MTMKCILKEFTPPNIQILLHFVNPQNNHFNMFCRAETKQYKKVRNNVDRSIIKNQLISLVLLCRFAASASTYSTHYIQLDTPLYTSFKHHICIFNVFYCTKTSLYIYRRTGQTTTSFYTSFHYVLKYQTLQLSF